MLLVVNYSSIYAVLEDSTRMMQDICSNSLYQKICHRKLKLEETFLDTSPEPCMKICDFSYSKSVELQSAPRLRFKTAVYIPPEAFSCTEYDGKIADVWSCGATLYVLLVGAHPFEDEEDHRNYRKTIQNILAVQYEIPEDCKHLLSRIFVANPVERITIDEIKKHPWFLKNLPKELTETAQAAFFREENSTFSLQTVEEIMKIVEDAKTPPPVSPYIGGFGWGEIGDAEGQEEECAEDVVEEEEEDKFQDENIMKKMKYTQVEK